LRITVVDYGLGNVKSVLAALTHLNFEVRIDTNGQSINAADLLVIPGVASFGAGVYNIKKFNQFEEILNFRKTGKTIIGLCLGAQLFLKLSEESPGASGLALIEGVNKKLDPRLGKTPNQGWSKIEFMQNSVLSNKFEEKYFYFSHSYKMDFKDSSIIVAKIKNKTEEIPAIIQKENLIGLQFHPERSGMDGLALLYEIINEQAGLEI
jgi:glutamine amidotransferase